MFSDTFGHRTARTRGGPSVTAANLNRRAQAKRPVTKSPLETMHSWNSRATDGELVYVTFLEVGTRTINAPNVDSLRQITRGRIVVAAYDFEGNQKWIVRPGEFISAHGFCSCPVTYKDSVIVNGDHDGDSYIVALDKSTGIRLGMLPGNTRHAATSRP